MGRKVFSFSVILLFVYVASPLVLPVAMGAVFAILFFPLLEQLEKRKLSGPLASTLLTAAITLLVLLPGAVLLFLGTKAGLQQVRAWRASPQAAGGTIIENLISSPGVHHFLQRVNAWYPVNPQDVASSIESFAQSVGLKIADLFTTLFTHIPAFAMGLAIMVISIYFFLVDGRKIMFFLRRNSVLQTEETERLIHSIAGMCRSVILATVISGIAQSIIFCLACLIGGVDQAYLIGFLVFLSSFVPLVGAAPITFGAAFLQLLAGNHSAGILLLIMAIVVAAVDNFIRPAVLKGAGNLHPLLAFIAAFGGLQVFGFLGVFLGPIIAGLCVAVVENLTATTQPPIHPV